MHGWENKAEWIHSLPFPGGGGPDRDIFPSPCHTWSLTTRRKSCKWLELALLKGPAMCHLLYRIVFSSHFFPVTIAAQKVTPKFSGIEQPFSYAPREYGWGIWTGQKEWPVSIPQCLGLAGGSAGKAGTLGVTMVGSWNYLVCLLSHGWWLMLVVGWDVSWVCWQQHPRAAGFSLGLVGFLLARQPQGTWTSYVGSKCECHMSQSRSFLCPRFKRHTESLLAHSLG